MNKEIKFRVWDKYDGGRMIYNPKIAGMMGDISLGIDDIIFGSTFIFMQFTGLKDKNGKEIYEGDILNHDRDSFANGVNVIVEWNDGGFYCGYAQHIPVTAILEKNAEVVGNIYENKELLTN